MERAIFRGYSTQESLRSDRSAGDRARHRQKVRKSIRDNIADIVAEESIIGKSKDKIIKVPIRGVKEYRFVYGENGAGVGKGDGNSQEGQVIGKVPKEGEGQGKDVAGDQPGVDFYETDVTLEELIEIMFEDLELPHMQRKILRQVMSKRVSKRKGYRRAGIRIRLDKKRTAVSRVKRRLGAMRQGSVEVEEEETNEEPRFPFHKDDMKYSRMVEDERPESNAVVFCIMDTSGSMDTMKKYLARNFFFLLYQFVCRKYQRVEIVFIAHHTEAREVTEEEFFHKGESGGTMISSGYNKTLEIIQERYHPSLWNVYAFHCSDGDNFDMDDSAALKAAVELCGVCNLFGYGEIKPSGTHNASSMLSKFKQIGADNFAGLLIEGKEDVWPALKGFLQKDKQGDLLAA